MRAEAARVLAPACRDVIQIKHLRKVYPGGKVAVRDLSFGVPVGEVFGFLGINGAGKTTSLSILTGGTVPSGGGATLAGYDVVTQQPSVRRLLGYVPQSDTLLDHLTTREHLLLYARLKGVPHHALHGVVRASMAELGLSACAKKVATSLSRGNKRKLCVAVALVGRPPLLILDEPTTGVDAVSKRFLWSVLTRIAAQDKACSIILTTHSMEEAEALCTRIGIMVGGRLRCLGSSTRLKDRFGAGFQLDVRLHAPSVAAVRAVLDRMRVGVASGASLVHWDELPALCVALGRGERAGEVSEGGRGWPLLALYHGSGTARAVEASAIAAWWEEEDRAESLCAFVCTAAFPGASLKERQGAWLRFAVPHHVTVGGGEGGGGARVRLSAMFHSLEAAQGRLNVATLRSARRVWSRSLCASRGSRRRRRRPPRGWRAGRRRDDACAVHCTQCTG